VRATWGTAVLELPFTEVFLLFTRSALITSKSSWNAFCRLWVDYGLVYTVPDVAVSGDNTNKQIDVQIVLKSARF